MLFSLLDCCSPPYSIAFGAALWLEEGSISARNSWLSKRVHNCWPHLVTPGEDWQASGSRELPYYSRRLSSTYGTTAAVRRLVAWPPSIYVKVL